MSETALDLRDWTIVVKLQTDDPHHARMILLKALGLAGITARTTTLETSNFEANVHPAGPSPVVKVWQPEHETHETKSAHRRRF